MWSNPWFWAVLLTVAAAMEFWAMFVHEKLWHGSLWWGHRSHHRPNHGMFELNDLFSGFHAALAIGLIALGTEGPPELELLAAIGFGMTAFGVSYFVVHDGFIHGRLPVEFLAKFGYFRRLRNAHKVHHLKDHEGPFGLFLGEWELRRNKTLRQRAALVERELTA